MPASFICAILRGMKVFFLLFFVIFPSSLLMSTSQAHFPNYIRRCPYSRVLRQKENFCPSLTFKCQTKNNKIAGRLRIYQTKKLIGFNGKGRALYICEPVSCSGNFLRNLTFRCNHSFVACSKAKGCYATLTMHP